MYDFYNELIENDDFDIEKSGFDSDYRYYSPENEEIDSDIDEFEEETYIYKEPAA